MKGKTNLSALMTLIDFAKMTGADRSLMGAIQRTAEEVLSEDTVVGRRLSPTLVRNLVIFGDVQVRVKEDKYGITELDIEAGESRIAVLAA